MNGFSAVRHIAILLFVAGVAGCAGSSGLVDQPDVDLTSVKMSELSLRNQTFLLGFNVRNPNPFPLPVRSIRYRIRLNDHNFAGGVTQGNFTIPAGGDESFVISVDLDLLQSGARLTSIIRSGVRNDLDYQLDGDLAIDIPMSPSVRFSSSGTVMVQSEVF